ncbi:15341_t:CDS:2 [Acaulospora colombiana]|uniref:15341_t:CDS:1 n=1 Tax=Acaulospora colombiana TaxID=27376 RepID=A0ACA9M881_9GLOM|nr:15341_t:CDS:2 [Acaulospora colombiana]
MDDTNWGKLKLPELKSKCKELGLYVSGTKKVLVERIQNYYASNNNSANGVNNSNTGVLHVIPESKSSIDLSIQISPEDVPQNNEVKSTQGNQKEFNENESNKLMTLNINPVPRLDSALNGCVHESKLAIHDDDAKRVSSRPRPLLLHPTQVNGKLIDKVIVTKNNTGISPKKSLRDIPTSIGIRSIKSKRKKLNLIVRRPEITSEKMPSPEGRRSGGLSYHSQEPSGPVLFPMSSQPRITETQHREMVALRLCLERTDSQTVLKAEKVCRFWQYAALHAWRELCKQDFPGGLLENVLQQNPNPSTSLKFYYKRRLEIKNHNITLISRNWIGRLYENLGHTPFNQPSSLEKSNIYGIDRNLYSSNDHPYQFFVTLRFWIARFYYYTQCGGYEGLLENMPNIERVVPYIDGVWKVKLDNSEDEFVILGDTGEVIGHENIGNNGDPRREQKEEKQKDGWAIACEIRNEIIINENERIKDSMRADWASYISLQLHGQDVANNSANITAAMDTLPSIIDNLPASLIGKVITENPNYPHSIHKHITPENDPIKYTYAARYVLSNVEPFTISGTPETVPHPKVAKLLAFKHSLAECVEEIRFRETIWKKIRTTIFGETMREVVLSESVCFVQTTSRGVFVLKDTGQVIGTEDDGINYMWQMILGCGFHGERIDDPREDMVKQYFPEIQK